MAQRTSGQAKTCLRCESVLPVEAFSKHRARSDGLQAYCKQCYKKANGVTRQRHASSPRNIPSEKRCGQCEETKPSSSFYRDRGRPDGLYTTCRTCHRRNTDAWKKANPEATKKIRRASYVRNAERNRAYSREYQQLHRAERAAYDAEWKRLNRARATALEAVRRARKAGAAGKASPEQVAARVAYYGGKCWICGQPWEQIDHVKPISRGGPHWPANLRPACADCNRSKNNRWPLPPLDQIGTARRA